MCRVKPCCRAFWKKAAPTTCSNDKFPNVKAPWQKTFIFIFTRIPSTRWVFCGYPSGIMGKKEKTTWTFQKMECP